MIKNKPLNSIAGYLFIGLLFSSQFVFAQTGEINGSVTIPAVQKEVRMFRGNLYRNRLNASRTMTSSSEILKSAFIDIIISAHPLGFKPVVDPLPDTKILQKDASFLPRVVPVTPGTIVQFINKDRFFHNVFSITPGAMFNIGRRSTNVVVGQKINKLGEIKIFCDIHPQMNAIILSLDTPYFTRVEANGKYKLGGLPPGTYRIKVYHPDFPQIDELVTVKAGEIIIKDFAIGR